MYRGSSFKDVEDVTNASDLSTYLPREVMSIDTQVGLMYDSRSDGWLSQSLVVR